MSNKRYKDIEITELSSYTTPVVEVKVNSQNDWVPYGSNNNYFNDLVSYYKGSTTSASIINSLTGLIYGDGLKASDAGRKPTEWAALNSMVNPEDLKKIIFDRKLLGMAAMKVIYKNGKVQTIKHWPMDTLRAEKADKSGNINSYYWSTDWTKVRPTDKVSSFPAFGTTNNKKDEIYVIKPYVTSEFYYTQPDYAACLPYCVLEDQIGDYLINEVISGFSGTTVINVNGVEPLEEEQEEMDQRVRQKVIGATGQKTIVSFNSSPEENTTVEKIQLDDAPDRYRQQSEEARDKIIVGHRITSPLLLGVRENGNGFGSNADEIETASLLMDKVVVGGFQKEIIKAIDTIIGVNGISLDLYFGTIVPRDFRDEESVEAEEEADKVENEELSKFIATHSKKETITNTKED